MKKNLISINQTLVCIVKEEGLLKNQLPDGIFGIKYLNSEISIIESLYRNQEIKTRSFSVCLSQMYYKSEEVIWYLIEKKVC